LEDTPVGRHLCIALIVAGCATASTPEDNPGSMDVVRTTVAPRETMDITRDNIHYKSEYAATRDEVLRALLAAEQDIGIPFQASDPRTGTVVHYIQATTPTIAGKPAWTWVDCGTGAGGTPRASTYRVTLTLTSVVEAVGNDRARVLVTLVGTARDRGMSADAVQCASTGQLEKRVHAVIAARLTS
jgi:hypothetical protein